MSTVNKFPSKDPSATLDYIFDWAPKRNHRDLSDWLRDGETIVSATVTVDDGLVKSSEEIINNGTAVMVWIGGGVAGTTYEVSCTIQTNGAPARIDKRTATIFVEDR